MTSIFCKSLHNNNWGQQGNFYGIGSSMQSWHRWKAQWEQYFLWEMLWHSLTKQPCQAVTLRQFYFITKNWCFFPSLERKSLVSIPDWKAQVEQKVCTISTHPFPVFENKNIALPYLTDFIYLYKIIHIYCYEVPFMTSFHDFLHIWKVNSFIPFSQVTRISCYLTDLGL